MPVRALTIDVDQAIGIGKWQGLEKKRVDEAEYSSIRADANGQQQNGNHRRPWVLQEQTTAVPKIVKEGVHQNLSLNQEERAGMPKFASPSVKEQISGLLALLVSD
jgi:hypothetical protein